MARLAVVKRGPLRAAPSRERSDAPQRLQKAARGSFRARHSAHLTNVASSLAMCLPERVALAFPAFAQPLSHGGPYPGLC
jgi:hypothetical protein